MKLARLDNCPEIFHTLQGEGVSVGKAAVFVRTSRCNLHCRWCDTDYTWNFKGTPWEHDRGIKHDKAACTFEISPASLVERLATYPCRHIVLTGGEPLLQQEELLEAIRSLRQLDPEWTFEVETNGTRIPDPAFEAVISQFNVSPKLAHSGMDAALRIVPAALTHFARNPKAWFKFVASSNADIEEIEALAQAHQIPASRIVLMPEGRTSQDLDRHSAELAARVLEKGWRFSDRLHVRLWGDRRGV
ncbi:organic radical activating enzyme [Haloferula luteola]|uniref:7-carboxy-7-deazaguanine synthase n=1 Tax=Haloferula luteola TaxID=595692 RepID=A0A840V863_9BACT|nr:7-carboxy-7-deazaguanine synthase QueE [Haloferula luteola]MBB5350140.1 organic radical activating enzyme [Haloferula luteola]